VQRQVKKDTQRKSGRGPEKGKKDVFPTAAGCPVFRGARMRCRGGKGGGGEKNANIQKRSCRMGRAFDG